ncbi:HAD family hydrolase [bacterium]|jgi:phosphoglycolate phosphatase|nr:HAD family hydrolase [bacterium]
MYKVIGFDLDGTILDSLDDLVNAVNKTMDHFNLKRLSKEEVRVFIGAGTFKLVERAAPKVSKAEVQVMMDYFLTYYSQHANILSKPFDGMVDELKKLKEKGYKLAVITNKKHEIGEELVAAHFPGIFDAYIGQKKGIAAKPDYSMFEYILEKTKASKEEFFYFGDTDIDARSLLQNNLQGCLVTWGFRHRDELEIFPVKHIIDKVSQINEVIDK